MTKKAIAGQTIEKRADTKNMAGMPLKKAGLKKVTAKNVVDSYLTTRILKKASSTGFTEAARKTMEVMGYNVVARNGWIMKIFSDGSTQNISEIKKKK
ncbi:MAG: hypothetical protein H7258_06365 [Ferruginibacter sp.]|nr:hypothetical protein [Ferruginibacter sp.]